MADNKKYYYMRLKENFFDSDEMIILENMDNGDGIIYSNILLKLYLRSLKYEGRLMFNDRIPFNPQMLSTIVRHPVGVVEKALKAFIDLGLVEIMDNGAIYMLDIQNFIGKTTTEADRQREYQARIAKEKKAVRNLTGNLGEISEKITPETEIELEKELKIDIDIE
ncbi:phage replisome organizer N-terminal domain-containing protein, partial [Lactococcus petauri]